MNLVKTQISHDQRKKIYALAGELYISNEDLHEYMITWSNTASLSRDNCTMQQADKIINALLKMKDASVVGKSCLLPAIPTGSIGKPGFITENQFNAINKIAGYKKWDMQHLNNFIKHTTGKLTLDGLTMKEASAVITGLKKI